MKNSKKLTTLLLALLMTACFSSAALAAPAAQPIKITVDGHTLNTDVAPQAINNRTMVPIRVVSEALAANVDYNAKKEITITTTDGKTVKFQIGSKTATVIPANNDIYNCAITTLTMDVTPQVKNNRTLVPIRFAAEALDSQVGYDAKTKTVSVNTPALTVDGKKLNTMTDYFTMIIGGKTTGYYGNANVAQLYKTLTEGIGTEVAAPENFGRLPNVDLEIYYVRNSQYRFFTGEPDIDKSTGQPMDSNPAIRSYETYSFMPANPDANPPAGYTKYLIRDLDTDKWYQFDEGSKDKLFKLTYNHGINKVLFNDIG